MARRAQSPAWRSALARRPWRPAGGLQVEASPEVGDQLAAVAGTRRCSPIAAMKLAAVITSTPGTVVNQADLGQAKCLGRDHPLESRLSRSRRNRSGGGQPVDGLALLDRAASPASSQRRPLRPNGWEASGASISLHVDQRPVDLWIGFGPHSHQLGSGGRGAGAWPGWPGRGAPDRVQRSPSPAAWPASGRRGGRCSALAPMLRGQMGRRRPRGDVGPDDPRRLPGVLYQRTSEQPRGPDPRLSSEEFQLVGGHRTARPVRVTPSPPSAIATSGRRGGCRVRSISSSSLSWCSVPLGRASKNDSDGFVSSTTGPVAGAANEKPGSGAHGAKAACPACVLQEGPCYGDPSLGQESGRGLRGSFMPREASARSKALLFAVRKGDSCFSSKPLLGGPARSADRRWRAMEPG